MKKHWKTRSQANVVAPVDIQYIIINYTNKVFNLPQADLFHMYTFKLITKTMQSLQESRGKRWTDKNSLRQLGKVYQMKEVCFCGHDHVGITVVRIKKTWIPYPLLQYNHLKVELIH